MARSFAFSARRSAAPRTSVRALELSAPTATATVNIRPGAASNRTDRAGESERDRDLIQRAQRGDDPAFAELVERHQRRAFSIAFGLVRDEEDASEIVQEAFLRVYRGL